MNVVQNKTWLRDNISPYEIYLKILYEFFREKINTDKESDFENNLPENFARLQYQNDADKIFSETVTAIKIFKYARYTLLWNIWKLFVKIAKK